MTTPPKRIQRETSILMSTPMVRATLDGSKTQTRRILNPHPPTPEQFPGALFGLSRAPADGIKVYSQNDYHRLPKHPTDWELDGSVGVARDNGFPTRYRLRWAIGDRMRVREAWRTGEILDTHKPSEMDSDEADIWYVAGAPPNDGAWGRYRHGRYMPRWASRITLEVTHLRIQRLQDISEEDAMVEGIEKRDCFGVWRPDGSQICGGGDTAKSAYRDLWVNINGAGSWDKNPWVAAITYRRIDPTPSTSGTRETPNAD